MEAVGPEAGPFPDFFLQETRQVIENKRRTPATTAAFTRQTSRMERIQRLGFMIGSWQCEFILAVQMAGRVESGNSGA
jgi:hypothetical protein